MCITMAGFCNCLRGKTDRSIMASGLSDVAANQEPTGTPDECPGKKRSKFQAFKKLFAKNKQNEAPSPTGVTVLKSSQSTDDVITPEPLLVQSNTDNDSASKVNMGTKALSRDSVFLSESPSSEPNDGLISSQENIHGEVKSLQDDFAESLRGFLQLKQAICVGPHPAVICPKKGDDTGALSEDDGLPHSPPEIYTLHTVLAGSSHRSSNPVQRTSSLSLEGSDTDNDQLYCDASSRPATPLMSLPVDFSQPASPAGCLDSSAAHHRIAIKHKAFAKRKPARRKMSDGSKSMVLGEALGLNEELSMGSTEPDAEEQGCKGANCLQNLYSFEDQGERTEAQHLSRFQQAGEDPGIVVQLFLREGEQSAVQDLSDMGSQHMGMSHSITKCKLDTEEILPALVQEFQQPLQTWGEVNDKEPGPLPLEMPSSMECTPTLLPASEPEGEVPETQQGCRLEVSLGEGQATPDVPHVEELSSPGREGVSPEQNEEGREKLGECDGEKAFASHTGDQTEEHCLPEEGKEEKEEGEQQCLSEKEEEEEGEEQCLSQREEELEDDCMKAEVEVATHVYWQDSPRQEKEEEDVQDSADEAGLLSNTYSKCGSNTSLECTMEFSWSVQAVEGGKCTPEPPIMSSLNSDSVLPCLEETSSTTANISLRVDSEPSTEKHDLSQASDDLRKPQACPGSKAHFTIAPVWQRLLPTGSSKELFFTAPVEPEAIEDSPHGARDPHHKMMDQNEGLLHPQEADSLSWPDKAQSAALLSTPRGHSPEEVASAENPFGVKLRGTSALLRYSASGSSVVLENATPKEPFNPPQLPVFQLRNTKSSPLNKVDDTTAKVKKTPELGLDAPERKVASASWIFAARQKQKVFKNNLQEETPTRQSPLEIEPKRKILLPISLNQTNAEQPEPSSSPLTAISCSREISRPATVEEGKSALSHSHPPSPLGQEEPPWLAQAKKKAKAWSEMPQTV
ncbi:CRACD-like protein isoform X2 [Anguilla rostrata]|uniref:CRACD-like protein isoform X2 n=1 Tax=Anguilla rostrata TaxID=7938 RepID=UPI0030CBC797